MFQGTIAGLYPAVWDGRPTAALALTDVDGPTPETGSFVAAGVRFTILAGLDHRPDQADFPLPPGRVVTLIVSPDEDLVDLADDLTGQRITVGAI